MSEDANVAAVNTAKRTRVPLFSAFFMIYIFVSGGSFGIEEMVASSGPGLTLLLLLALPVIWALPMALIASELGSAIPDGGGFMCGRARGDWADFGVFRPDGGGRSPYSSTPRSRIYRPLVSATYLQNQIGFSDEIYYAICWSVIGVCTVVNVLGIKIVAIGSSLFAILIISPIVVLGVIGLANWQFNPFTPMTPPDTDLLGADGALIIGLSIGMWFYSGYESMSTLAGEIEELPSASSFKALMLALPHFVALMYLLPTLGSLAAFGNWELFSVDGTDGTVSFVDIGRALGGTALGHALLASVVLGNLALYLDYYVLRRASAAKPTGELPSRNSADGLLPNPSP